MARRSVISPSIRIAENDQRFKRQVVHQLLQSLHAPESSNSETKEENLSVKKQKLIGTVHLMFF